MALSRVLDRVGQVLGRRYRLVAAIGTGASATVYLADDTVLGRRVAVKILHVALAEDEAFLRRFRAEARSAAALNHPHVVAVYDWGEDTHVDPDSPHGVPFLVTEYLDGGSLRALLDRQTKVTPAQALLIGLEAARGLEFAHRRGFVHRDIKPANLLFDDEARLRIADFGLARALADATWTEPVGGMVGTIRYASPEQARGESLDGKSDVYALAVVIVEALTGEVPFSADTPLGTLMARIDRPLPVPDEAGSMADALRRAGHPHPDQRLDAAGLTAALTAAATGFARPAALVFPGTGGHTPIFSGIDLTVHDPDDGPAVSVSASAPAPGSAAAFDPDVIGDPVEPGSTAGTVAKWIGLAPIGDRGPDDSSSDDSSSDDTGPADPMKGDPTTRLAVAAIPHPSVAGRPRRRWMAALTIVAVLAVSAGGAVWWFAIRVPYFPVPDLVGRNVADLDAVAGPYAWTVTRADRFDASAPAGQILDQDPPAATDVARGGTVAVTVSSGPPPVAVPAVAGQTLDAVTAAFGGVGLGVGAVQRAFDETAPVDTVLSVAPDTPAIVAKGSNVALVVSAGPEPRTIPDGLVGRPVDQATAALKGLGLGVLNTEDYSDTIAAGSVIAVKPGVGEKAAKGSVVNLTVSKGPPVVDVPDVRARPVLEAAAIIEAAGLQVNGIQGSPTRPVSKTNPAVGTSVRRGTSISLITA